MKVDHTLHNIKHWEILFDGILAQKAPGFIMLSKTNETSTAWVITKTHSSIIYIVKNVKHYVFVCSMTICSHADVIELEGMTEAIDYSMVEDVDNPIINYFCDWSNLLNHLKTLYP